jgi:hypothetical protein
MLTVAGKSVEVELRRHFMQLDTRGNSMGWPRKHIWHKISSATLLGRVTKDSATVAITNPIFNMKLYGGVVTPKRTRTLAIPNTAAAYSAGSPREGVAPSSLKVLKFRKSGALALAEVSGKAITVWYWLVKRATIKADPEALPSMEELESKVGRTVDAFVQRQLARSSWGVA